MNQAAVLTHPLLGRVMVIFEHRRSRTARWTDGHVTVKTPPCSEAEIMAQLDRWAPRLLQRRQPEWKPADGMLISCEGADFAIGHHTALRHDIVAQPSLPVSHILVHSRLEMDSTEVRAKVLKAIAACACSVAPQVLLPRARELAASLGAEPAGWRIGRGSRALGICSAGRVITLSHRLVFLPRHLRDFIVCHELAHLTEMNHSPRFHELCNRYCQGRERELRSALSAYTWPVPALSRL